MSRPTNSATSDERSPIRPLDRELFAIAWPAVGSGLVQTGHTWIDMAWVGRIDDGADGRTSLAAVAIASFFTWVYQALGSLVGVGLGALVARYVGAGRLRGARYVASQGLRGCVALALATGIAGWWLAPWGYAIAGAEADVAVAGIPYVRIYWGTGLTLLWLLAATAICRGHGNTSTPFLVSFAGLAVNALADPILIFGWGPIPALGVAGSAWATALAQGASALILIGLLTRSRLSSRERPPGDELRLRASTPLSDRLVAGLDLAVQRRIGRVGLPIAIAGTVFSSIYIVIGRVAETAGGAAAQAGLGVGHRGEAPAWILGTAYAAAASSMVGRSLGAGRVGDAERAAWRAVLHCALLCGIWSVVLLVFDETLARLFTDDAATLAHGSAYYRIVAWCIVFQSAELVLEGAFGGAGLTVPPMLISTLLTVVRIPVAWWVVASGAGVEGLWWVLSATALLRGLVMAWWFRLGTWKHRSV